MKTVFLTALHILLTPYLFAQPDTTMLSRPVISGDKLDTIEPIDYNPLVNGFARTIQSKVHEGANVPDSVLLFLQYAREARQQQNDYYAFRYSIKAIGAYYKNHPMENYEVAAGLKLVPQQGISALCDTIGFKFKPLFNLGRPLSGTYTARFTVKTGTDSLVGEFQTTIREMKEHVITFPVQLEKEGIYYVGYQLIPPRGEPFPEVLYTFLAFENTQQIIIELQNILSQRDPHSSDIHNQSIYETFSYFLHGFVSEQHSYQGFQRNFPAIGRMMFFWDKRDFRQNYTGKINYPYDIALLKKYITLFKSSKESVHQTLGDNKYAISTGETQYFYYRLYVPSKYNLHTRLPLIATFPMGFEVDEFFNDQEYLRNKAEQFNCFILCLGSLENGKDEREKQLFSALERVKKLYAIDTNNIFLTGGGNSGSLVWQAGLKYAGYFKAIAPVGGSALWLSKEHMNGHEHLPILLVEGNKDAQDIYRDVHRTKDIAQSLFHHFNYLEMEGEEHISIWKTALPRILDFFIDHMNN